ncbi:Indoleamine 2,3-dioxygenase [Crucibulum laeve]|uniref:Indoleamine 2,3-dioxygenase n=1 Tax=Crucibulum laeve TaxID=68775 RepID=A0A5C3LU84_9AGAR|nr:Indoleamine 2,3-dioxygenase [Crucibulum laeve]
MNTNSVLRNIKHTVSDALVFDVDQRTGFMAPHPPLTRLPQLWEPWESTLDEAIQRKLQLGDKLGLTEEEKYKSERWRSLVRELPIISIEELDTPVLLRRGHLILTYILHFYVQSLPPDSPVLIPRPISLPLLRVSKRLDIPPLLTFSDTVLYNWVLNLPDSTTPDIHNIRSHTLFSGLSDEEEFYLCSARIELRGVEALELMRVTMDETFVGDAIAVRRISGYLRRMAGVINELKALLLDVQQLCDPDKYYNEVRPWFRGEDSDINKRKWKYEGVEEESTLSPPLELSGPSAGQSSMVHVLDIFLGVNHRSASPDKPSFMARMQSYMPRNHRLFLDHLASNPRPLRTFVMETGNADLLEAYNLAVLALKEFRDAHMVIATLYILGPARRAAKAANEYDHSSQDPLKGTGGTNLVKFLKDTRNRTKETLLP